MAGPWIPTITKRAPTIDFIDQRLPKHHPLFASQAAQYDPVSKQFVPGGQALGPNIGTSLAGSGSSNIPYTSGSVIQRPEWTKMDAMSFWISIFPESMTQFGSWPGPKGRTNGPYDIRNKKDWNSVYEVLELARQKYQMNGGLLGKLRKVRRYAADRATPGLEAAKITAKVVPQDKIATPVVGAVEVVLDALKASASVRNSVLGSFDDLVPTFSDVELFLAIFPGDANVRNASIDLVVTTLIAIERAIGFFISNDFVRGGKAILSGAEYQKDLTDSLEMIRSKSVALLEQAERSHIFESHEFFQHTKRHQVQLLSQVDIAVNATNSINHLLTDHLRVKEQYLQRMQQELDAARRENMHLRIENGALRSVSPEQISMWIPPQQHVQATSMALCVAPSVLRQMIDTFDLDLPDAAFVLDKKEQLPVRDRSRVEQIVNTPHFRNWIVSASSARLLIHWDRRLPKMTAGVSPLSAFCMTLVQSLRAKDQFVSAIWFCGQHIDISEPGLRTGGQTMLSSLIDQILRQHQFDSVPLHNNIDVESLQDGNLTALSELLRCLVRQLPPAATIFFIVDGVALFERDEFQEEAMQAFLTLIQLVSDTAVMAAVKVLFTSTPGTDIVRAAFEQDDLILNVDNLPASAVSSDERMMRELGDLDDLGGLHSEL